VELYLHSPNTPSWCGAQLKHRDNFTFYDPNRSLIWVTELKFIEKDEKFTNLIHAGHFSVTLSSPTQNFYDSHGLECAEFL
jgi:hypothetical protein